ncbi:hypothetical protein K440DRAFT_640879 [Wilcoxina mikolae CBS 423.85]|nr:hypothetical protein K440DRAFT_640879 [Wilcoxina mikolae CBS 423.85]
MACTWIYISSKPFKFLRTTQQKKLLITDFGYSRKFTLSSSENTPRIFRIIGRHIVPDGAQTMTIRKQMEVGVGVEVGVEVSDRSRRQGGRLTCRLGKRKTFLDDYLVLRIKSPERFYPILLNYHLFYFNQASEYSRDLRNPASEVRRWNLLRATYAHKLYVFKDGATTGRTMGILMNPLKVFTRIGITPEIAVRRTTRANEGEESETESIRENEEMDENSDRGENREEEEGVEDSLPRFTALPDDSNDPNGSSLLSRTSG